MHLKEIKISTCLQVCLAIIFILTQSIIQLILNLFTIGLHYINAHFYLSLSCKIPQIFHYNVNKQNGQWKKYHRPKVIILRNQRCNELLKMKKCTFLKCFLNTPEPRYSKRARQTPFVYYIKSFTISRHSKKWKIYYITPPPLL